MQVLILQIFSIATAVLAKTGDNLVKHTISAEGINASYIGYGARLTNLYVKDKHGSFQDVVLGYDEGSGYIHDSNNEHTYFGAVSEFHRLITWRRVAIKSCFPDFR